MSEPAPRFALTPDERQSGLWARLSEHFTSRLEELRRQNDNPDLTAEKTAALRGRIAHLKEFLALEKEPPAIDG